MRPQKSLTRRFPTRVLSCRQVRAEDRVGGLQCCWDHLGKP